MLSTAALSASFGIHKKIYQASTLKTNFIIFLLMRKTKRTGEKNKEKPILDFGTY